MPKSLWLALAALLPGAALAASPAPQIDGGSAVVVTIHGAALTYYRLARGSALTARAQGPGALEVVLRSDSGRGKAAPQAELDGKPLSVPEVPAGADKDFQLAGARASLPATFTVRLAPGAHALKLTWPATAASAGLVRVTVSEELALPGAVPAELSLGDLLSNLPEHPAAGGAPPAPKPGVAEPVPLSRTITARPATAELPAAPAPLSASEPAASAGSWDRFGLDLRLGAERSSERYTAPSTLGGGGAELAWWAKRHVPILASVDLRLSHQAYSGVQRSLDGRGPAGADVDETRLEVLAGSGYDFGPMLLQSGRLVALPLLGVHYLGLRNGAFPGDLAGLDLGGRVRYALSPGVGLSGSFGWTYNLLSATSASLVGAPKSHIGVQAGLSLPLPGGYSLELAYRGDFLAFHYDLRASHGATVGFHSSF